MKIKLTQLAQYRHVRFLIASEKQALIAYRFAMTKLAGDLRKLFKKNKLAKSDDLEKAAKVRKPGKNMVDAIYVHRSYEHTLPQQELARAKVPLGDYKYDVVKHNKKNGAFSFIQSPDFDTAHEPIVGNSRLVTAEGAVKDIKAPNDPWIYHHKWQFVGDDYRGFDVNESKSRSKEWQAVPDVDRSRIGKLSFWNQNVVPRLAKGALRKSEDLEKGLMGDWQKEGYTPHHEVQNDDDGDTHHIFFKDPKGKTVADGYFYRGDDDNIHIMSVGVHPDHQRKGLATAMYAKIEASLGGKIAPNYQSEDAKALWSQPNRPFGLKKSDDTPKDGLESGWTGEVPQLEVDLSALANKTINKYLDGLRWVLMGDFAGKEASKAAADIGLKGKVTPGIIQAAYLHSLDSHSQHYEAVTSEESPGVPEAMLKASMEQINKRVQRFVEQNLSQLKLDLSEAVNRSVAEHNFKMLNSAHKEAHERLPESGAVDAVAEAGDAVNEMLRIKDVLAEVSAATDKFEGKWDMAVKGDLAIASAAGTHVALLEIHGRDNKDVRVVWQMVEDEKTCTFCSQASRNADGSFKYYKISDFEPSGYNYGKKKADWKLCIVPAHPRCRCILVFVPKGFSVDSDGSLVST